MKQVSWRFIREFTPEDIDFLKQAVAKSHLENEFSFDSKEKIIESLRSLRQLGTSSSFSDFITDIGEELGCTTAEWDKYRHALSAKILIDIIERNNNSALTEEMIRCLNLSNRSESGMRNEINARVQSSKDFQTNLLYVLCSINGIDWGNRLKTLPVLESMSSVSNLFSNSRLIPAIGGIMGSIIAGGLIGASIYGVTRFLFSTIKKTEARSLYPIVSVLLLTYQEHSAGFATSKEAISYIEYVIRFQQTFERASYAAISLLYRINSFDAKDNQLSTWGRQAMEKMLDKKHIVMPNYRIQKMIPYKSDIIEYLISVIYEDFKNEKEHLIDERLMLEMLKLSSRSLDSPIKSNIADNKAVSATRFNKPEDQQISTMGIIGACVSIPSGTLSKSKIDKSFFTDFSSKEVKNLVDKVKELEEKVYDLSIKLEEKDIQFRMLRHDMSDCYQASVAPLYDYERTKTIDEEDLEDAIRCEKQFREALKKVGKDDYGFIGFKKIPTIRVMVEEQMKCDEFSFVWNPNADFSLVARIPESTFVTRVLGNIRRNIIRHAFGVDPYKQYTRDRRKVEGNIYVDNEYAVLTLSNNGAPISSENIKHIFDREAKFGPTAHTGLGLYYVACFMEHWGGQAKASIPSNAYNFEISLYFKQQDNYGN